MNSSPAPYSEFEGLSNLASSSRRYSRFFIDSFIVFSGESKLPVLFNLESCESIIKLFLEINFFIPMLHWPIVTKNTIIVKLFLKYLKTPRKSSFRQFSRCLCFCSYRCCSVLKSPWRNTTSARKFLSSKLSLLYYWNIHYRSIKCTTMFTYTKLSLSSVVAESSELWMLP
jgi:hypothetical protein